MPGLSLTQFPENHTDPGNGSAHGRIDLEAVDEAIHHLVVSADAIEVFDHLAGLLVPVVCDRVSAEVTFGEAQLGNQDEHTAAAPDSNAAAPPSLTVATRSSGRSSAPGPSEDGSSRWMPNAAPWLAVLRLSWLDGYRPTKHDVALVRLLCRYAVAAVDQGTWEKHLTLAAAKISNLNIALNSNRTIGAAVGVLMSRRTLTYEAAFSLLSESSHRLHRKIADLATEVLYAGDLV